MLKMPLIIGSRGGMGHRYSAILRSLGVEFCGVDKGDSLPNIGDFDGVIIATPTIDHVSRIRRLATTGVPILCEKPISTKLQEVLDLCRDFNGYKLAMVNQYDYLAGPGTGDTVYDYFRHGSDGLAYDCINILGMATGSVRLGEDSPEWFCKINGRILSLSDMDRAYVNMIKDWLTRPSENFDYIRAAHRKVEKYIACQKPS